MQNQTNRYLIDSIQQESYLPEINAEACIYSKFDQANCKSCVESCPTQAWVLDEESLGLNATACNGCGLCVPACATDALHVQFPWIVRQFNMQSMALFSCEKSDIKLKIDTLPCIHMIGLRQLLLIYNSGIKYLLVTIGECPDCERYQLSDLSTQLSQLNKMLLERNKTPMKVIHRSAKVWKSIFKTDEIISRGIKLSRRDFLHGKGHQYRQQMLLQDPLNMPECRTVPPGQLLPATDKKNVHWPCSPLLNNNLCNGCDACMNLCPTQALVFTPRTETTTAEYRINPANCNGCGICETVCESNAISIKAFSKGSVEVINLEEQTCNICGNKFHLPHYKNKSGKVQCRICQIHKHNDYLFQVMG